MSILRGILETYLSPLKPSTVSKNGMTLARLNRVVFSKTYLFSLRMRKILIYVAVVQSHRINNPHLLSFVTPLPTIL